MSGLCLGQWKRFRVVTIVLFWLCVQGHCPAGHSRPALHWGLLSAKLSFIPDHHQWPWCTMLCHLPRQDTLDCLIPAEPRRIFFFIQTQKQLSCLLPLLCCSHDRPAQSKWPLSSRPPLLAKLFHLIAHFGQGACFNKSPGCSSHPDGSHCVALGDLQCSRNLFCILSQIWALQAASYDFPLWYTLPAVRQVCIFPYHIHSAELTTSGVKSRCRNILSVGGSWAEFHNWITE